MNISESTSTDGPPEPEPKGFELVDNDGNIIEDANGIRGLLIYNGGTVCNDGFGDREAYVICQEMGYNRSSGWTSWPSYDVQNSLEITLDNVDCDGGSWSSCDYLTTHNCGHYEDVFLTCLTGEKFQPDTYKVSHAT